MSDIFENIKERLRNEKKVIVLPEGSDERIIKAASRLTSENLLQVILVGDGELILRQAHSAGVSINQCTILNPSQYDKMDEMVDALIERRKGRIDKVKALQLLQDENYFGTMLLFMKKADGLVSGAIHSTADTVRPALQIIKTKPNSRRTSGLFIMLRGQEKYIFADCAINIAPDSDDLAEIAIQSAETASLFGISPRVGMLSFSTKGSAQSPETEKVKKAVEIVRGLNPNLLIDGEFQFDAAFVPEVAEKKAPNALIKGDANVFIFPSLEAGNIGYKLTQRLGKFEALGPILQGLNQPVNDLSRGCNEEDVYKISLITAAQSFS